MMSLTMNQNLIARSTTWILLVSLVVLSCCASHSFGAVFFDENTAYPVDGYWQFTDCDGSSSVIPHHTATNRVVAQRCVDAPGAGSNRLSIQSNNPTGMVLISQAFSDQADCSGASSTPWSVTEQEEAFIKIANCNFHLKKLS
jgi:hypothetical protein